MNPELPYLEIYTDGGCDPNPGPGGWAAILIFPGKNAEKELSGWEILTTNNRMELTAAIEALKTLKQPCRIELYTDSDYLKRGITEWISKWKQQNWMRKDGEIPNSDLWQELDALCKQHEINWQWVKGHAGNKYNERADELASAAMPRAEQKINPAANRIYLRVSDEEVRRTCSRGWAACIVRDGDEEYLSGGHPAASPNHFALFAVLEVLNQFQDERPIQFFIPNKFLYDGITGWVNGWRDGGWVKPENFRAEWKALDKLDRSREIEWIFMRHPMSPEYDSLKELTAKAKTKAPHLPMPPEVKENADDIGAGTIPMF